MKSGPACITGLGCICAAGESLETIIASLYSGKRNYAYSSRVKTDLTKNSPVFEVSSNPDDNHKGTSVTMLLLLAAAKEASAHALINPDIIKNNRVGVVIGTTVGCTLNNEPFYRSYRNKENPDIKPLKSFLNNNPALYLSGMSDFNGPAVTIANACSSGTDAIGIAKSWIENGHCDIVFAGGTDELCRTTYIGFTSLLITSPEPCRPFDLNRNGLNLGEGAGIVIVENEESAKHRGAEIMARITGYGSSGDAHHPTAPHPDGLGIHRAIDIALREAKIRPDQVAFINAHGTSTIENDRVEAKVIKKMFLTIPVVSTKSYTGHTLGAAGGIEAVLTIKALLDKQLPATVGFEEPDPECGIIPTTENTPVTGRVAISNSLAFGGNNSVLVFETDH